MNYNQNFIKNCLKTFHYGGVWYVFNVKNLFFYNPSHIFLFSYNREYTRGSPPIPTRRRIDTVHVSVRIDTWSCIPMVNHKLLLIRKKPYVPLEKVRGRPLHTWINSGSKIAILVVKAKPCITLLDMRVAWNRLFYFFFLNKLTHPPFLFFKPTHFLPSESL